MTIASIRPIVRARFTWSAGSLPARIEMNTMLSMPRTISSAVSVSRAIQICGVEQPVHVGVSVTGGWSSRPASRGRDEADPHSTAEARVRPHMPASCGPTALARSSVQERWTSQRPDGSAVTIQWGTTAELW